MNDLGKLVRLEVVASNRRRATRPRVRSASPRPRRLR